MNKNQLKKEILILINTLKADVPNLSPDTVPDQEFQHFIRTIEALYKRMVVLQHLHLQEPSKSQDPVEIKPVQEVKPAEPVFQQPVPPVIPQVKKEQAEVHVPASLPKTSISTSGKPETKRKGLLDLKTIVTLNEKFIFTNQLFKGNVQAYNEAINSLNAFQSLDEAKTYLSELKVKFAWDLQNDTTQSFIQLIERSFAGV